MSYRKNYFDSDGERKAFHQRAKELFFRGTEPSFQEIKGLMGQLCDLSWNIDEVVGSYRVPRDGTFYLLLKTAFEEIFLNVIKYASYAEPPRILQIDIQLDENSNIQIRVVNSYDPDNRKGSSGLGESILDDIADLLGGQSRSSGDEERKQYTRVCTIRNRWEGGGNP